MELDEDALNAEIQVFMYIDGTDDYANFSIGLLKRLALFPDMLHFTAVVPHKYINKGITTYPNFSETIYVPVDEKYRRASSTHALALNQAINQNEDIVYIIVVIDADVAILYNGWDQVVRQQLAKNCCFGFNRHNTNFPSVFFFSFKRPFLGIRKIDFLPDVDRKDGEETTKKYIITNEKEAKYRKQTVGSEVKCDTGYMLPMQFRGCGFGLECIPNTSKFAKMFHFTTNDPYCKANPWHMCEWHYNNVLFGTHKQACRNHPFYDKYGKIWRNKIASYVGANYSMYSKEFIQYIKEMCL